MHITIDSHQRIFLIHVHTLFTRSYFCNLKHIPAILKDELEPLDSFTISEYWNFKFTKVSKKKLNEYFEANQIDFKLK